MQKYNTLKINTTFESLKHLENGVEFWLARELMPNLGYKYWQDFDKLIQKVKEADFKGESDHIRYLPKLIKTGKGATRETTDYKLSRFACYKVAMLGNTNECVQARSYFAIQTRKQELYEESLEYEERLKLRQKSKESYKSYTKTLVENGVPQGQIGIVTSLGDKALFGKKTVDLKKEHNIPASDPLEDYTHSLNTTARMFGRELTKEKINQENIKGLGKTISTHTRNNQQVRNLMLQEGIAPEKLPMQKDLKQKQGLNAKNLIEKI
jgi:DNA-damage-inducible protein D